MPIDNLLPLAPSSSTFLRSRDTPGLRYAESEDEIRWFGLLNNGKWQEAVRMVRDGHVDPRLIRPDEEEYKSSNGWTALHYLAYGSRYRSNTPTASDWEEIMGWGIPVDALSDRGEAALDCLIKDLYGTNPHRDDAIEIFRRHGAVFSTEELLPHRQPLMFKALTSLLCDEQRFQRMAELRRTWERHWTNDHDKAAEWPWLWWGMTQQSSTLSDLEWAWSQRPDGTSPTPNLIPSQHLHASVMNKVHMDLTCSPLCHLVNEKRSLLFDHFQARMKPDVMALFQAMSKGLQGGRGDEVRWYRRVAKTLVQRGVSLSEPVVDRNGGTVTTCRDFFTAQYGWDKSRQRWIQQMIAWEERVQASVLRRHAREESVKLPKQRRPRL